MSRVPLGILVGVLVAAVIGVGILLAPDEPRPGPMFLATCINGGLLGLVLATALRQSASMIKSIVVGAVLGGLLGLVIALANGFEGASFVAPLSIVEGAIIAAVLKTYGVEEPR